MISFLARARTRAVMTLISFMAYCLYHRVAASYHLHQSAVDTLDSEPEIMK